MAAPQNEPVPQVQLTGQSRHPLLVPALLLLAGVVVFALANLLESVYTHQTGDACGSWESTVPHLTAYLVALDVAGALLVLAAAILATRLQLDLERRRRHNASPRYHCTAIVAGLAWFTLAIVLWAAVGELAVGWVNSLPCVP